ncbi:MAG TPA: alpha/beta hydrolase family protein [Burkholderiaceae bacterium]|nr:alpha/beta hydrolase family protein [Burkholderiaceae bacterium]
MSPATYVLVHGAFHGGWCWRPVAAGLRKRGHEVFTPTQTGLGERRHLMSSLITMETFVQDILATIEMEELSDVILVGHSFGGRVIAGVADRIPQRIRHLVFIDGGLPLDGLSRLETMSPDQRDARMARARVTGGISIPAPPASTFGVSDAGCAAWLDEHLTPQPLGAEASRLVLSNPVGNGLPATYVRCTAPGFAGVESSARYAQARKDWKFVEVKAGHNVIVTDPPWTIGLLHAVASVG